MAIIIALSILTVTVSIISFSKHAIAANESDLYLDTYLKVESFSWKEFDNNENQLLKESGPIFAIGYSVKWNIKPLTLKSKAELFGGSINYDGRATGSGIPIYVETETEYLGVKIELDSGWKFTVKEKSSLEPYAGLGVRRWKRDIESTDSTIGLEETWRSVYARLGIRGDHIHPNQIKTFFEVGVILPFDNENELEGHDFTVTVEPGKNASVFAEAGLKWKLLKTIIFYEVMKFSKSDTVTVRGVQVWQPKSEADIFGINIGVAF